MLLLLFDAGGARYGLDASRIVEVLPVPALRPIARAPSYVAGLLNYHGLLVPVLDLTALITGDPAPLRLSSRIVIVDFRAADGTRHPLGLLAERATEAILCRDTDFQPAGIQTPEAPFAGEVFVARDGAIQRVDIEMLLPAEVQQTLFRSTAAANA